jgi:hypothetical protein
MSVVIFQCDYGSFQPRYLWFFPVPGIIGFVGVPVGVFWNEGWVVGGHPLEPWAATVIIEILAVGALLLGAGFGIATVVRRTSPHRIAVTASTLIVPKGIIRSGELQLPRAEIDMRVFHAGFVKQLQIRHNRRRVLLSSALFPSNADFDRLVGCLQ